MKMNSKKLKSILIAGSLAGVMVISGTLAYLTQDVGAKENVFTVGDIDVSLDEEVGIFGEGGDVKETEDGAEYIEVMPGDYLKKEVTVTNNGKNPAYVAVTVTLNNVDKINAAIDEVYENEPYNYNDEQIQAIYTEIFDGWGINYDPRPGVDGNDARGVIDGTYGLPENALKVDFTKTVTDYWLYGNGNWFHGGDEKANQYWVDSVSVDNFGGGYYAKNMDPNEICYTYYLYLPEGESSTLFNGLNVPAEFNADQLAMFEGLTINVEAKAIQADNMGIASQYVGDTNGEAKTAFAVLAGDIDAEDLNVSNKPVGSISGYASMKGQISYDEIWGEAETNAKESVVIKIYSGNTYLGSTSLNDVENIIDGTKKTVTWSIALDGASTDYWTMNWEKKPTVNLLPTTAELLVDGETVGESVIKMDSPDDLNPITGVVTNAKGEIVKFVTDEGTKDLVDGETYVAFVSSNDELANAISNDATAVLLADGTYNMPASAKGKTLTINGSKDAIIKIVPAGQGEANGQLDYNLDGSTVTFNNVTILTNNQTYAGYARLTGTYNNCTFEGQYHLQRDSKFTNCTFNVSGDAYNIWTWGAPNATFTGCTFNCDGKSILVYNQSCNLTVNNCVFNDNGDISGKAAIEACNGDNGVNCVTHNITVNNTTVNGFDKNNSTSTLWGNKNSLDDKHLNIVVDDVVVY